MIFVFLFVRRMQLSETWLKRQHRLNSFGNSTNIKQIRMIGNVFTITMLQFLIIFFCFNYMLQCATDVT